MRRWSIVLLVVAYCRGDAWPALPPHTKEAAIEHWSSFYAASSEDLYTLLGVQRRAGKRRIRWAFRSKCVQKLRKLDELDLNDFFEMARAWDVLGDPERRREYDTGGSRLRQETAWRLLRLPALKKLVAVEATQPRRFCRRAAERRWWRDELEAATQARALALSEGEGAPATTWADMAWTATVAALVGGCVQLVRGLPPRRRRDGGVSLLGMLHEAGAMADRVLEFYLQEMRAAGLTVCAVVSWAVLGKAAVLVLHENIAVLMLVVTRIALLPLGRLVAQLRLARLRRHASTAAATLRRSFAGLRDALPALPVLPAVDCQSLARALRVAAVCCGRALRRTLLLLLLWLRVAGWVVLFSVLWGASLALVVLATTWVALDVLSVPGQDLDSVLARLKQMDNALVVLMIAAPLLQPGVAHALWSQGARAVSQVRRRLVERPVRRLPTEAGDICVICFDELGDAAGLTHCRWGCGRAVHAECMEKWLLRRNDCVFCQAWWS
mmetsp:Transcript_7322/g.14640  ORF Transcript_7322/g.14640 Transcript_7322/m.14640 type:complete len:497 (+) Transcript_7322:56-1546(+)